MSILPSLLKSPATTTFFQGTDRDHAPNTLAAPKPLPVLSATHQSPVLPLRAAMSDRPSLLKSPTLIVCNRLPAGSAPHSETLRKSV